MREHHCVCNLLLGPLKLHPQNYHHNLFCQCQWQFRGKPPLKSNSAHRHVHFKRPSSSFDIRHVHFHALFLFSLKGTPAKPISNNTSTVIFHTKNTNIVLRVQNEADTERRPGTCTPPGRMVEWATSKPPALAPVQPVAPRPASP